MSDLTIPQKDKGYNINFTVVDSDGNPYPLTGYTVKMIVWKPGIPGTSILSGGCIIDSSTGGTCHYVVTATGFTSIANYKMELELIKSGVIESSEDYDLRIKESGGGST
jgi:hypothetical protein